MDPERLVLMGDWNAILDPNIDKVGGASGSVRCDSTLSDLMASCDLVDRFRLDHPGREMWTWHPVVPSHPSTYLDRMLVRRGDVDFLSCPTFHLLGHSDHKLVMARLNLSARPKLAGYWKFNSTLLELEDYRLKVTELIQRALVGAVTGSKWWVSLKAKIRRFSVQYSQRLALDKAKAKKRLEDKMTRAVEGGDPLAISLAKQDLSRLASERYEGQVVRARLKKVSNEAVNVDAVERKAALRRGSDGYIRKVHNLEGHALVSTREICEGFREHLSERFTQLPGLRVDEFGSYLADSPRLTAARAASCDGLVTEHEVITALRQVGCNKSPGLDGLPYEFYLRLSPMLVPILKDVFNHWFAQGSIPGQVTKGVITLLRKGKRHGGEENFDDFRPLTLLNTELKILAKILANRLQVVITDLIEPDQSYAVKGRSIQDNLHLIRSIIEGTEDDAEAALISLDQSKAFDRVDHRFLGSVLEAAGFNPDFRKWIFVLYDRPTVAVQVNGKLSESFAVSRSVRQGCPLSPLLYILALEPILRKLRDEATTPVLRGIALPRGSRARVSAFADDVTVFVSCPHGHSSGHSRRSLDMKKLQGPSSIAVSRWVCGWVPGPEVNSLPGIFSWTDGPVRILGVWFGPGLQLEKKLVGSRDQGQIHCHDCGFEGNCP